MKTAFRRFVSRAAGSFLRDRHDAELVDELNSHLDAHIADNVRAGMTPDEARRRALVALGGIAQTQEQHRSVRSIAWIDDAREDVRYAFRAARRSPGFALTALAVIA